MSDLVKQEGNVTEKGKRLISKEVGIKIHSKCLELRNMVDDIGFDGVPDENIPSVAFATKEVEMFDSEKKRTASEWVMIMHILNDTMNTLWEKDLSKHTFQQHVRRIMLVQEVARLTNIFDYSIL